MAVLLTSASTQANPTGGPGQHKLVFDGSLWWSFFTSDAQVNKFGFSSSPDLVTWSAPTWQTAMFGPNADLDGGFLSVVYRNTGTKSIIMALFGESGGLWMYRIGVITGAAIAWGSAVQAVSQSFPTSICLELNAANVPVIFFNRPANGYRSYVATSILDENFADTLTAWNLLGGTGPIPTANPASIAMFALAGTDVLAFTDIVAAALPGVSWTKFSGATWSAAVNLWTNAGAAPRVWAACKVGNTDVRVLGVGAASTLVHFSHNGTAASALTAPAWPAAGVTALTLESDGTDLWALAIGTDASISYAKYSGTTWSAWQTVVAAGANARTGLSGSAQRGAWATLEQPILYTEANGANFDVYTAFPPVTIGALAASLGGPTAALAGTEKYTGSVGASLAGPSAQLAGTEQFSGAIATAALGGPSAQLSGGGVINATLAASLGGPTAALTDYLIPETRILSGPSLTRPTSQETVIKDPDSIENFTMPWGARSSGLVSVLFFVTTLTGADGLTVLFADIDGLNAAVRLAGGVLNSKYLVTCRVTTLDGETLDYSFRVSIKQQ